MAERDMSKQKPPRTPPPLKTAALAKSNKPAAGATAKQPARAQAKDTRKDAPKTKDATKALESAVERLEASISTLKRERDDLAARLASAQAEIAALDTARKAAIDRIDWVIDSLHTALQDKS
jgi:predicted RNase H-like nuclease (RuvC/YqgF family)